MVALACVLLGAKGLAGNSRSQLGRLCSKQGSRLRMYAWREFAMHWMLWAVAPVGSERARMVVTHHGQLAARQAVDLKELVVICGPAAVILHAPRIQLFHAK